MGAWEIVSSITTIDDHRVRYRGHDLAELVGNRAFEAVAELLWTGRLEPAPSGRWQAPATVEAPVHAAGAQLPSGTTPADRLRVATAVAAAADRLRADLRPDAVRSTARGLLATLAGALGRPPSSTDGVAARAAASLGADRRWVGAIEAALVLLADHELATSTLAARVAASSRADPYQVVLAGLAAVSGPLHGSASTLVVRLLLDASHQGPEVALAASLRHLGRVPGLGHPLYPQGDPRAPLLLERVRRAARSGRPDGAAADPAGTDDQHGDPAAAASDAVQAAGLEVVDAVLAATRRRWSLEPNVDYALGSLVFLADMHPASGEALFSLARSAGWVAHALEEYEEDPLRFRVRTARPRPGDRARLPGRP
jgi:citrate synthase